MQSSDKTDEKRWLGRFSNIDAITGLCVLAVFLFGIAAAFSSKDTRNLTVVADVPIYYPVAPPEAAPAPSDAADKLAPEAAPQPAPAPDQPQAKQLANSSPAFISLLGDDRLEASYYLSQSKAPRDFYGGRWAPENIESTANGTTFSVKKEGNTDVPFSIAEASTYKRYGYGRYEAIMQIGKGSGLVSAFFTYTGPYFGDPHDEVDIEFLGKDTTKIHFNYWRNGKRGKFATFDLPFDASEGPHLYAFEWLPDRITWYVDGVPYYASELNDPFIPKTAGKVHFSHWTGIPKMREWHGKPDFGTEAVTTVSCSSFTPMGEDKRSCSDVYKEKKNS
ncbi:family 16 glycosylhydrolase [Hyphomonas pacifica]|uniref:Beta-glucanase n=1 Tax=Hyphomonas pacifica TaxID=1280941 RepID=A0A062U256_9PROT|nr:family 16 glycosylhydrolase [Hyphomonas pacifica]KCZ51828.1 hypothetical protein HY2_10360 [Hyphomonas pacifica]RAN34574.1 hypothetical protein HY3_10545 [Hyphomonas pacifica]